LATEFEKFMYAKYPGDPAMQLEAMNLKIVVIFVSKLFMTKEQRKVAKKIAKKMIATFNRIPFPTDPSLHILSYTYNALGEVYLSESTKESAEIAVEYFEKDFKLAMYQSQIHIYRRNEDITSIPFHYRRHKVHIHVVSYTKTCLPFP